LYNGWSDAKLPAAPGGYGGRVAPPRRPDPPPEETDDVRIITLGTVAWAAAFVVLFVLRNRLAAHGTSWWLVSCVVGVAQGLFGIWYCRRRRAALGRT
jgi:Protein of unknown function (DUF2530)